MLFICEWVSVCAYVCFACAVSYLFARYLLDYIFVFLILTPLCSKIFLLSFVRIESKIPYENIRVGLTGFSFFLISPFLSASLSSSSHCCHRIVAQCFFGLLLTLSNGMFAFRCPKCFRQRSFVHTYIGIHIFLFIYFYCCCLSRRCGCFCCSYSLSSPLSLSPAFHSIKFSYDLFIELYLRMSGSGWWPQLLSVQCIHHWGTINAFCSHLRSSCCIWIVWTIWICQGINRQRYCWK